MNQKLQIKISSFDVGTIEETARKIVAIAKAEKAAVVGPVPLPTHRQLFTVLRATHIKKSSREQFEIRTHKRLLELTNVNEKLKEAIKRLKLSSGVSIKIKQK